MISLALEHKELYTLVRLYFYFTVDLLNKLQIKIGRSLKHDSVMDIKSFWFVETKKIISVISIYKCGLARVGLITFCYSYLLKIHRYVKPIGIICIMSSLFKFVDADDFFGKLFLSLKKHNCVRDLRKLPEVFVPVIKFRFNDIGKDFIFDCTIETVLKNVAK